MMFVIVYDRRAGVVLEKRCFEDERMSDAKSYRQRCERKHAERADEIEVVILDAENEAALEQTHGKYFGGAEAMIERTAKRTARR